MKKILTMTGVLLMALNVIAAPEEYVTKGASGSTAATVYFEPGPRAGALLVADVTSDKAASVLSWKTGTNMLVLLADAASNVTNMFTTVGDVVSNTALVSVTAAGTVTAHTGFTNSYITNNIVYLENPIGTNVTTTSIAREVTGYFLPVLGVTSPNIFTIASNLNVVASGTNFLFRGRAGQWETNVVLGWVTNGANFDVTLTNNYSFPPMEAYALTNSYNVTFAATATSTSIIFSNCNSLIPGDQIVILPSTGGAAVKQIQSTNSYRYQSTNIKATTGVALTAGDRIFVLDTGYTTPVGATTLRLMADPVRILPPNMPGVLSVDGTSACTVNAAVVRYK